MPTGPGAPGAVLSRYGVTTYGEPDVCTLPGAVMIHRVSCHRFDDKVSSKRHLDGLGKYRAKRQKSVSRYSITTYGVRPSPAKVSSLRDTREPGLVYGRPGPVSRLGDIWPRMRQDDLGRAGAVLWPIVGSARRGPS